MTAVRSRDPGVIFRELLLNKDAGHAALFRDLDGKPKIVMHGCDAHHGSEYPVVCDIHEEDDKIEIVWR